MARDKDEEARIRRKEEIMSAVMKGMSGAGLGGAAAGAAGAAVGKGASAGMSMQDLAKAMTNKSKSKMGTKEFEVPTEENMNRPKATRPGGPRYPLNSLTMDDAKEYGMKKGGSVSSASKRADGIAIRGKTRA